MTEKVDLKVGSFYWVMPTLDPDTDQDWEHDKQPARFAGRTADGTLLWNCLNVEGESEWPMRWVGAEICH